jgi:signal transduction histidine kinase
MIWLMPAGIGLGWIGFQGIPGHRKSVGPEKRPHVLPAGSGEASAAALVAHEFKNYLCTLKGNSQLLRQRGASGDNSQILDRIDHVVEKLERFAEDLRSATQASDYGREPEPMQAGIPTSNPAIAGSSQATYPEAGKPKATARAFIQIGEVARICVRNHFHSRTGAFHWDTREDFAGFHADPNRFEQVFLNLYVNAMEAGAQKVETRVRREGDRLLVTLEDDGKGCDPEKLEKIFEPFFTTKVTAERGTARRGLGMFIVQSIVENHGGKIRVHSKNGSASGAHGLVFTLELPIREPSTPHRTEMSSRPEPMAAEQVGRAALPSLF